MIVERERLNEIVAELQLVKTGVVDSSIAGQVGRVAKVDWVLFGSFLKEGDHLKIEAHILDLKTQELLRVEWVEGLAKEVLHLEKRLVQQLLERLDIPITEEEKRSIMYVPTDSVSAFKHYSKSLDLYDNGQWFDSLLECRLAVRNDPNFIKTRARMAKLYYETGKPEHALVEYRKLVEADRDNTFPEHIYYKMGRLLEDRFADGRAAVVLYEKILARHSEYDITFDCEQLVKRTGRLAVELHYNGLRALERLALMHEERGEDFKAAQRFSQIVYFLRRYTWADRLLANVKERVWAKYAPLYWHFVRKNRDTSLCPPHEVFRIPAAGTASIEIRPEENAKYVNYWKDIFCIAPVDREIAEVDFNIDTDAAFVNEDGSVRTIQAGCFAPIIHTNDQSRELKNGNGWQRVNYKVNPGVRALIVRAYNTARWNVTLKSRDWAKDAKTRIQGLVYVRLNREWKEIILDGKYHFPVNRLLSPDGKSHHMYMGQPVAILHPYSGDHMLEIRWANGHQETNKFHVKPRETVKLFFEKTGSERSFYEFSEKGGNLNLLLDRDERLWLLWDRAYADGVGQSPSQESRLFYTTSIDGKMWNEPKQLLASLSMDMRPVLQQSRNGTYWLIWISNRDHKEPQCLWIASSEDGTKWTFPRKIAIPVTETERKTAAGKNYPSFAFTLDKQDTFWLIWQERLFKSTDAQQWKEAEELTSANGLQLQTGWDGFGEYLLTGDDNNNLLFAAKHEEAIITSWGSSHGGKTALWRRGDEAKWKFLGFLDEKYTRSFCIIATNTKHTVFLVDSGNEGLLLRAYDGVSGWSGPRKIDDASDYSSNNAVAAVGENRYICAYCNDERIVVLTLDGVTFDFKR